MIFLFPLKLVSLAFVEEQKDKELFLPPITKFLIILQTNGFPEIFAKLRTKFEKSKYLWIKLSLQ